MDMKQQTANIALCAIGRQENRYAQEFVSYYQRLGFAHIYLYDNNRNGEERLADVLSGFPAEVLTVIPWPDATEDAQRSAYNDCYERYGSNHEWLAFFDFDEYLTFTPGNSLAQMLDKCDGYQCIFVNWMNMTDSGLLRYDPRPLTERFTQPMPFDSKVGGNYPENNHVKSIVRTGIPGLRFRQPHSPKEPRLLCCNARGEKCRQQPRIAYDHTTAYLRHYTTKTIGEWLENKMQRGVPDRTDERFRQDYQDFFFKINERTPEKEAVIQQWYHRRGRVAAVALGRMGNQMFIAAAAMTFARRTGREFIGLVYNHGPKFDYDYPAEQFATVMRNVKYIEPEAVAGFYHMQQGEYLSNGFPDVSEPDVVLCDYYQDNTCIDRDIALQLFAPYDSILQEISHLYGDLSDCVCVNVRRGDYLKVQRRGFRVLTADEIRDMLDEHFPTARRVLFVSDDIEWCRADFGAATVPCGFPHGTTSAVRDASPSVRYIFADLPCRYKPETDLYLMTQCGAGCIISNSTFSWWGAYLNEKGGKIVCPWPWFTDQQHPKMTNLLPPTWIKHGNGYTLWVTYHKDELIQQYNLREDEHHRLFAAHHDPTAPSGSPAGIAPVPAASPAGSPCILQPFSAGKHINPLNPFYSEFVTLYYVWANRVRSAYVGFCHYRRLLTVTRLPNPGECQVRRRIRFPNNETIYDQYARCHNVRDLDLMLTLIDRRHGPDNPYTHYLRTSRTLLPNVCFLMAWRDYMQMGDFLFPLLADFAQATGCAEDPAKWHAKAVADFGHADAPYQQRLPGFLAERLVSAWIAVHLKWYL